MIAKINTVAFSGIDVIEIEVQVHFAKGQPGLTIVGLGDKAVTESRERIRAVLSSLGLSLPPSRITINLAPADVIKEGTHFDLPIAMGILAAMQIIDSNTLNNYIILGELSLDGDIRSVSGILPAAMNAVLKNQGIICPKTNGEEAAWAGDELEIIAASNMVNLINHLKNISLIPRPQITNKQINNSNSQDIAEVEGQYEAKWALEIAASGAHNLLFIGQPGTGKSMLASRITTILPPLDPSEMLEVSMIHSISGLIKDGVLSSIRPFRSPHHSASMPSIIGGGRNAKPGEITIAHRGVLFLDELPEYPRQILESLRQPLETGETLISRIHSKVTYPAKFQLIAAMNPCHCGFASDPNKRCQKGPNCQLTYQAKISGPLLDRIDIHTSMNNHAYKFDYNGKLITQQNNENKEPNKEYDNSEIVKKRVIHVRDLQKERYKEYGLKTNSDLSGSLLKEFCMPKSTAGVDTLNDITERLKVSMRGISKILKVARTIADIYGDEKVDKVHLIEAAKFRSKF